LISARGASARAGIDESSAQEMTRSSFVIIVAASLLIVPAWAQASGAALATPGPEEISPGRPSAPATIGATEPLSRAQITQLIADQGYFEIANLTRRSDGLWTCTALSEPGRRVTLTVDAAGRIAQRAAK
jgi:hypothetical protein